MRLNYALGSGIVAAIVAVTACRLEYRPPPVDSASVSADSVAAAAGIETGEELTSFRRDKHSDLTGDGRPEKIIVRARGQRSDDLTVTLRIEGAHDSLLYADTWNSFSYLKYADPRTRADRRAVRGLVQVELERLVADSNLGAAVARRLQRTTNDGTPATRREVVQRDVAEALWRQRRGMQGDSAIPATELDSVEALVRARPDRSRVQQLLSDIDATNQYFMYHRGGEETLAIAWSPREHRFVRFWGCC